jgi:Uma2 family endonuclease
MLAALEKPAIRGRMAPLTIGMYHDLVKAGSIDHDLEFLEGVLIEKMPKSPLHEYLTKQIFKLLQSIVPTGFEVNKEAPITIGNSEPEPDISVVKGNAVDFKDHHPTTAELVVEIAISSEDLDFEKANIYARAHIPMYIVVHGTSKKVSVFTEPTPLGYKTKNEMTDQIKLSFPNAIITLSDIFS